MNPFVLNRVECKIAAFKGDGESHGDKEKKCVDLTLTITGDITVLDPDLVDALTKLVDPKDAADGLFKAFRFSIGERVSIVASGETGKVVGRAEFATAEPSYLIRYARADGVATEAWWPESALEQA